MPSPYNYFASMLAEVLDGSPDGDPAKDKRGLTFDDLDGVRFAGWAIDDDQRLPPQAVQRLKQALQTEGMYFTLNDRYLEKVIAIAHLTEDERLRLIAAILTTKIQAELASRITPTRAYIAAERLFPLILEGVCELENRGTTLRTGGVPVNTYQTNMLTNFERRYFLSLTAIDRGLLALNALRYLDDASEKRATAQQAYDAFTLASQEFGEIPSDPNATWSFWKGEALRGQAEAYDYLV